MNDHGWGASTATSKVYATPLSPPPGWRWLRPTRVPGEGLNAVLQRMAAKYGAENVRAAPAQRSMRLWLLWLREGAQ